MISFAVNYLAILVSAIAVMAIGATWYHKVVFGSKWLMLVGLRANTPEEKEVMNKKAMTAMVFGFGASLVMAFVTANVLRWLNVNQLTQALQVGFYIWLGFVATVVIMNVMYQQKKLVLFFIDSGFQLASILAITTIIYFWA